MSNLFNSIYKRRWAILLLVLLCAFFLLIIKRERVTNNSGLLYGKWGVTELYIDTTYLKKHQIELNDRLLFGLRLYFDKNNNKFLLNNLDGIISSGDFKIEHERKENIHWIILYNSKGKNIDGQYELHLQHEKAEPKRDVYYLELISENVIIIGDRTVITLL